MIPYEDDEYISTVLHLAGEILIDGNLLVFFHHSIGFDMASFKYWMILSIFTRCRDCSDALCIA
jgi:hypothetical protein